jgi:para-aminobenzoate synthetase component 1
MKSTRFPIGAVLLDIRDKLLQYASAFEQCAYLDSHSENASVIPVSGTRYDVIVAVGAIRKCSCSVDCMDQLQPFLEEAQRDGHWIFGHLSYDLKNEIEKLVSIHPNRLGFPVAGFFVPEQVLVVSDGHVTIHSLTDDPDAIWKKVLEHTPGTRIPEQVIQLQPRMSKTEYIHAVNTALKHIHQGDIYEMNMCHEFFAEKAVVDPVLLAQQLFSFSPNPFSCYYRHQHSHLICASPERFLTRQEKILLSQPIKGTAPRGNDAASDSALKSALAHDAKERSENVMIVDLVRNDLSRVAQKASVRVEELFGVYTFAGAHQMISTISCTLDPEVTFAEIIRAAFPMGSMTGAPKIRAMQIIEDLEVSCRGLFSGTVGYIEPGGNFDFNVVIRSIQYNAETGYLSVMAGGAITSGSDPEREYQETILKMTPQFRALGSMVPANDPAHA